MPYTLVIELVDNKAVLIVIRLKNALYFIFRNLTKVIISHCMIADQDTFQLF